MLSDKTEEAVKRWVQSYTVKELIERYRHKAITPTGTILDGNTLGAQVKAETYAKVVSDLEAAKKPSRIGLVITVIFLTGLFYDMVYWVFIKCH